MSLRTCGVGSVAWIALALTLLGCGGGGAAPPAVPASGASRTEAPLTAADGSALPTRVDCGDFATCARLSDGTVRCWGRNEDGELGDGGGPDRTKPHAVPGLAGIEQVALGASMGCGVRAGAVMCWGSGRLVPGGPRVERAKPRDVAGLSGVVDVESSGSFMCARKKDAHTRCWGMEDVGEAPAGVTQLAAGVAHACGVVAGVVKCWGGGDGDWTAQGLFGTVDVGGATKIATGDRHACALTRAGRISCWGSNDAGQLGVTADMEPHDKPAEVPGISGAVDVVAGETSTCAILGDGSVTCWGANSEGELGTGSTSEAAGPAKVAGLAGVAQMCLAVHHGCALTHARKIFCWGGNNTGQIGDGTKTPRPAPVEISL